MSAETVNKKFQYRNFKTIFINFGTTCLDILFPNYCPGCDKPLITSALPVCPRCTFNLERVSTSVAKNSICKLPQACEAFQLIFALWMFDKAGTVQHIHQRLKYKNRPHDGLSLGKLIGTTFLLPLHPLSWPDMILPVPLHRRRLFERGYNQSNLLAQGMSKVSGIKTSTEVLIRSAYTQTQTGLDSQERLANVLHAFSVRNPGVIYDKHVLLVDDVLTTGATLLAASLPLKEAGARAVSIATLAMARP